MTIGKIRVDGAVEGHERNAALAEAMVSMKLTERLT